MDHVVTQPTPPFRTGDGKLEIHQITAWHDNLMWLAVCTETGVGAVVDGPDAGNLLEYCESKSINLTTVLNTHTHGDHIGVNHDLAKRGLLDAMTVVGPGSRPQDVPGITRGVVAGDTVRVGNAEGRVMLTEGHINGHISFVFDDVVFCGDTMFGAGCGYLFDGPPEKMHDSLQRLAELDESTRVCCAHEYTQDNLRFAWSVEPDNAALAARIAETWRIRGEGGCVVPSTIALERETSPFLRHASPTIRAALAIAWPDRALDTPAAIFAATRALKDRKDYKSITDADLPITTR